MNTEHTESAPAAKRNVAWFVCRYGKIVDDILLPLKAGDRAPATVAKQGRMRAARRFKSWHGLHPCVRVDCEFQAVVPEGVL